KPNKKLQAAKGKGKGKGKGKNKLVYAPKPKNLNHVAKEHPTKDDTCHHYKEVGHWSRNCTVYLAELMMKKKQAGTASTLEKKYPLKPPTLSMMLEKNLQIDYESEMAYQLELSWTLRLRPNNTEVTSHQIFSKNDVLYFNAIPRDGTYETDMLNLVPNVNFIYNVSNKRAKRNLDSTYLWHFCPAHISKKRIEKLQHDGLLKSTNDVSFYQYVSCSSGKMTRKPFPHQTERENDLLRLIHNDVCGPLRHVSRQDASYFITFTNNFSRYGYVYFLKHEHEVFKHSRHVELSNSFLIHTHHNTMDYALESATCILNMVLTKMVDKTSYELWYVKFFKKNLISQEASGRAVELEEIQDDDTLLFENASVHIVKEECLKPQEVVAPVRRPVRIHRALKRLCLNVEVKEHSLWDLNEPTNSKDALLDPESNKWLNVMNAKM
nr:hypothetical protein [Tanacetum cinerariifolium]